MRSFIRYPGGKSRHTSKILMYFKQNEPDYRESFIGGGSVYLASGYSNAWINDVDSGVYDLWRMVKEEPDALVDLIHEHTPILEHRNDKKKIKKAINLWKEVKEDINHKLYPEGYRLLFLIKTCFSGVVSGGPTGGINQNSNYPITARWSKNHTIKLINDCHGVIQDCRITNLSWEDTLEDVNKKTTLFLDPPYLKKGEQCYNHSFDLESHCKLAKVVTATDAKYVVTVDDCPELREVWSGCGVPSRRMISEEWSYSMTASRTKNRVGKELFIVSDDAFDIWKLRQKLTEGIFDEKPL